MATQPKTYVNSKIYHTNGSNVKIIDQSVIEENGGWISDELEYLRTELNRLKDIIEGDTPPDQPSTAYYWYVGQTLPTALPTNDSQLATGLDAGWRKIGNTKPIAGTVIFDGTAQDEINIATTKVTQYFAINSDITIGSYDSFGVDQTSSFLTEPTVSNGMNIFTSVNKSKTFGQIIKVK